MFFDNEEKRDFSIKDYDRDVIDFYLNNENYVCQKKYSGERRIIIVEKGAVKFLNRNIKNSFVDKEIYDAVRICFKNAVFITEYYEDVLYFHDMLYIDGFDISNKLYIDRLTSLKSRFDLYGIPDHQAFSRLLKVAPTMKTESGKKSLVEKVLNDEDPGVIFKNIGSSNWEDGKADYVQFSFNESFNAIIKYVNQDTRMVEYGLFDKQEIICAGCIRHPRTLDLPEPGQIARLRYSRLDEKGMLCGVRFDGICHDRSSEDCSESVFLKIQQKKFVRGRKKWI